MPSESHVPPEHNPAPGDAAAAAKPVIPDFELIGRIGQGSYGDVWLARGLTGVYRAIKVVWRDRFPSAEPFEREFKGLKKFTTMSLPEASQLALLHVGQNEAAGFFYYVMELADDVATVREIVPARYTPLTLRELRTRRGRLPAAECVTIGVELARSLAGLHARGLVHRDIKPSNVILVGGVPKLADIGLVAETSDALTYVGTEGFVPPEGPGQPSADVFALGKLLYELATGLDREEFPRLPPELGKVSDRKRFLRLNEIILRACEPDSGRRYADAQAILTDLLALQSAGRRRFGERTALVALALIAAATGLFFLHRPAAAPGPPSTAVPPVAAGKSIAVLPFENMNDDKEDAFFADGIHEEILTDLANIASLRVISRTSVMRYRGTTKTLAKVAQELGVQFILEGSVRRVGQKVRVTGQLIRAAADEHIWAKAYDGDLSDILTLQTQLATAIAEQLKAVLTPDEARRLNSVTLANPKAYELYLRAKDLRRHDVESGGFGANPEAEELLRQATELDPKFAFPWAELARIDIERYFNDRSQAALRDLAKREIDQALALAPDRAEAQAALGEYYYYGFLDYDNAAQCLRKALLLEPSNADAHQMLGLLDRRLYRWRDAMAELRRAHDLDPLNAKIYTTLRSTLSWAGAYPEAKALTLARLQAEPDSLEFRLDAAFLDANITLSRHPFEEWLASLTAAQLATPDIKEAQLWLAFSSGQADRFLSLVESDRFAAPEEVKKKMAVFWAISRRVLGRDAGEILTRSRTRLEAVVQSHPAQQDWEDLSVICAMQQDRERAEFALRQCADLIRADMDPLSAYSLDFDRTRVLMWLGDKAAATDRLATLLRKPGPGLHPFLLKFSLDWWPLRGDLKFEALLADPATYHPQY